MFYYSYAYYVIYNCYLSTLRQRYRLLLCLNIVLMHVQCLKCEYNHCIIPDGLTKCEIQYPTDEDDQEDDPERCQVKKSHCELYVKACAQWWIPYRIEQYGGKRFVCRPYLPVDVQGSAELHVYIHEDIQGIAEVTYTSMNCDLNIISILCASIRISNIKGRISCNMYIDLLEISDPRIWMSELLHRPAQNYLQN